MGSPGQQLQQLLDKHDANSIEELCNNILATQHDQPPSTVDILLIVMALHGLNPATQDRMAEQQHNTLDYTLRLVAGKIEIA